MFNIRSEKTFDYRKNISIYIMIFFQNNLTPIIVTHSVHSSWLGQEKTDGKRWFRIVTWLESFHLCPSPSPGWIQAEQFSVLFLFKMCIPVLTLIDGISFNRLSNREDLFFLSEELDTRKDLRIEHLSKFTSDFYYVYRKGSNSCMCGTEERFSERLCVHRHMKRNCSLKVFPSRDLFLLWLDLYIYMRNQCQ